jgi:hypothetical protein
LSNASVGAADRYAEGSHIEGSFVRSEDSIVQKRLAKLIVIIPCFLLGIAATRIKNSISEVRTTPAVTTPTPEPLPFPTNTPQVSEEDPGPRSLSPFDLKDFIDAHPQASLTKVWQQLKIKTVYIHESFQLDPEKFRFMKDCNPCEAELSHYELDGEPGDEALLKVTDAMRTCRFLVFKTDGYRFGSWRLIGHIDREHNKYRMAEHSVLLSGGRRWLVIKSQGATGTGIVTYFDTVYLVTPRRIRDVLWYISEGHQLSRSPNPTREYFGHLESVELEGGVVSATVGLSVAYSTTDSNREDLPLFTKHQQAFFTHRLGSAQQVLDQSRSDLSDAELNEVYQIDSLYEEGFFNYNAKELTTIATGSDEKKKDWLRQLLETSENTPYKRRLSKLLNK